MPNKNTSKSKKHRFQKKKKSNTFKDADEDFEDDEHLFFDEEFQPPEGEDLDEPDYDNLPDLDQEEPGDEEGDFDAEGEFPEGEFDGEFITDDIEPEPAHETKKIVITQDRLSKIVDKTEEKTKRGLKMFFKVFSSAVNQGTEDEDDDIKRRVVPVEFEVEDGEVYNEVVTFALEKAPLYLQHFLKNGGLKPDKTLTKDGLILTNIYFSTLVKLIERTHDKNILIYILQKTVLSLKMMFLNKFMNKIIDLWANNESNVVKFNAFLNLRTICHENKLQNLEKLLRKVYLSLVKNMKHVTWLNHEQVTFMINCFVELVGVNKEIAYVIGFSYMREIAVHLKNCMKERTKDNVHKIYNWQFLNCIRLWFAVIGAYPAMDDLGKLAHPLIEISFGILKFYPHPRYAPLRIHLLSYLDEFSYKSNIYIPTIHYYFEIMKEANVNKKRDKTFTKAYDFTINVKVQKMYLKANLYYTELFLLALKKMTHSLSNLVHYISYPESIVVVKNLLRKFIKETKSKELRDEMKKTLELVEQNVKIYESKRKEAKITDDKNIDPLSSKLLHRGLRGLSLVKLSEKLRKENEEYIKQNILSEQEKFYAEEKEKEEGEGDENEIDEDQEGEDGEEDYDDGEDLDGEEAYDDEDGDDGDDGQFDDE